MAVAVRVVRFSNVACGAYLLEVSLLEASWLRRRLHRNPGSDTAVGLAAIALGLPRGPGA